MGVLDRITGLAFPAAALRRGDFSYLKAARPTEAFPLMATAARAGIAEAEYRVGNAISKVPECLQAGPRVRAGCNKQPPMAAPTRRQSWPLSAWPDWSLQVIRRQRRTTCLNMTLWANRTLKPR